MEENGFLDITFDTEDQISSGFHCCASFDEIFHRTPMMTIMLQIWSVRKWPKMSSKWPFWVILGHLA